MEWGNLLFSSYLFQILKERIYPQTKRHYLMWNTPPGGLSISPTFSHTLKDYPFYVNALSENPADKFTAIIVAVTPVSKPSAPLFKLIQVINNCKHVDQVNLWNCKFLVRYLVWNHSFLNFYLFPTYLISTIWLVFCWDQLDCKISSSPKSCYWLLSQILFTKNVLSPSFRGVLLSNIVSKYSWCFKVKNWWLRFLRAILCDVLIFPAWLLTH